MTHTFQAHSSAPNFVFKCGINGCIQTFRKFSAISSHIRRRHQGFDPESACSSAHTLQSEDMDIDPDPSVGGETEEDVSEYNELPSETEQPEHLIMQKACASLLLTLKERHKLSQSALDFSIGQVREVLSCVTANIKKQVDVAALKFSESHGIQPPDFSDCFQTIDPFDGLHSEYMQQKFYKEHFNLLVSTIEYWPSIAIYIHVFRITVR